MKYKMDGTDYFEGPWWVDCYESRPRYEIGIESPLGPVGIVYGEDEIEQSADKEWLEGMCLNNAYLCAAAPTLLEACEYAMQTIAAGAPVVVDGMDSESNTIAMEFDKAFNKLSLACQKARGFSSEFDEL